MIRGSLQGGARIRHTFRQTMDRLITYQIWLIPLLNRWSLFSRWKNPSTPADGKSERICYLTCLLLFLETSHAWGSWISFNSNNHSRARPRSFRSESGPEIKPAFWRRHLSLEFNSQSTQDLAGEHAHKGEHSQNHGNGDGYGPNLHAGAAQVGG